MSHISFEQIQQHLQQAQLAGHIYQQDQILVLQEPFSESGEALNIFVQHEQSADQLGMQFAIQVLDDQIEFLIGITHSNQDRSYEIGAGNLKGDQKAFNLNYAFYNYPKGFYLVAMPLAATSQKLEEAIETQLFNQPQLAFLDSALKITPRGEQVKWMKQFIVQEALNMKVRIQTKLL